MCARTASEPAFRVERRESGERLEIAIEGRLVLNEAGALAGDMARAAGESARPCRIDLGGVVDVDAGGAALLLDALEGLSRRGFTLETSGGAPAVRAIVDFLASRGVEPPARGTRRRPGVLEEIGAGAAFVADDFTSVLAYLGDIVLSAGRALARPSTVRWADVARFAERAGADGLPITVIITTLMGLILGFQASIQLKQFGANIYAADLVGISVTRELGPLIVAIIVAGRSGSAFAAELGTMRVSEEVDALRTLGIDPYRFLVFPRVLALAIALPLLTILGDACAIAGGMAIGATSLEIPPIAYLARTQQAVHLFDVYSGVLKAVFFALAIALIACLRGLRTGGGAEGVGLSTTSSVVTSLLWLVLIDFAFTIVFHAFGR
jgi:phospholipid/cholesterol/gamma-HCH transport system permease protein